MYTLFGNFELDPLCVSCHEAIEKVEGFILTESYDLPLSSTLELAPYLTLANCRPGAS